MGTEDPDMGSLNAKGKKNQLAARQKRNKMLKHWFIFW